MSITYKYNLDLIHVLVPSWTIWNILFIGERISRTILNNVFTSGQSYISLRCRRCSPFTCEDRNIIMTKYIQVLNISSQQLINNNHYTCGTNMRKDEHVRVTNFIEFMVYISYCQVNCLLILSF